MQRTLHLDAAKPADVLRAVELLRSGGTVAFATETVYGLGANALSVEAIAKIFAAKQRPAWDPLIVHLASAAEVSTITNIEATETQARVARLAKAFWPGPLTLLLPRNAAIPDAVTAGRPLVGVRVPAHPAALALLRAAGIPVAAPSANTFGHTSPTTAAHVLADLEGRIDAVLDAGPTSVGLESTVLDPTQTPMMLYRPGAIAAEQITAATGVAVTIFQPALNEKIPHEALPSPGVGIRHYAPRARLVLVDPSMDDPTQSLLDASHTARMSSSRVGVMLPEGWPAPPQILAASWGGWHDPESLARNLFACLRGLDEQAVDVILCPLPAPGGLADAIRDRLEKAARPA